MWMVAVRDEKLKTVSQVLDQGSHSWLVRLSFMPLIGPFLDTEAKLCPRTLRQTNTLNFLPFQQ